MIYIDESLFQYRNQKWCHMWSPDIQSLHDFAQEIGLKRKWFQCDRADFQHYDLSPSKRLLAIDCGAIQITCREMVLIVREDKDDNKDN